MIGPALEILRPGAQWHMNGDTLAGLVWVDQVQPRPTDAEILAEAERLRLPRIKSRLSKQVNDDAEACRLRFITPGAGKAMSYQEKLAEARLVLDDPAAVTSDLVPILAAEAAARGITVQQAAELVHGTYRAFKAVEAQINATAILATKAISDASDAAAARAAYEAITWPRQTP